MPMPLNHNPTPHIVRFVNQQGESFNTLEELEEYELVKKVHHNLFQYIIEKMHVKDTKSILQFLVNNRTEVITLLSNGNLETKHQNRLLK